MTLTLIAISILTGTLIGAIGIGGVLLAPFLHYFQGIELHLATAASSWSFLFTGIMGTFAYWRKGTIEWPVISWLAIGLVPGALLGAQLNLLLSSSVLTVFLALLILASAINTLLSSHPKDFPITSLSPRKLIFIGILTGFASALTGTGGPVILVPLLLILKIQPLSAIAASQVAQIPIALSAAIAFNRFAGENIALGTSLGIVQAIAVLLGAYFVQRINQKSLRRLLSYALILVVVLMLARLLFPPA